MRNGIGCTILCAAMATGGSARAEVAADKWDELGAIVAVSAYAERNCFNLEVDKAQQARIMRSLGYDDDTASPEMMGRLLKEALKGNRQLEKEDKAFNCGSSYTNGFLLSAYGPSTAYPFLRKR